MPELEHLTPAEMRVLLGQAFSQDLETSLLAQLARATSDPATRGATGGLRPHPLWLTLVLLAAFMIGVFFYFSFTSR